MRVRSRWFLSLGSWFRLPRPSISENHSKNYVSHRGLQAGYKKFIDDLRRTKKRRRDDVIWGHSHMRSLTKYLRGRRHVATEKKPSTFKKHWETRYKSSQILVFSASRIPVKLIYHNHSAHQSMGFSSNQWWVSYSSTSPSRQSIHTRCDGHQW